MVVSLESLKRLRTRHSKVSLLPLLLMSLRKMTTTQNQGDRRMSLSARGAQLDFIRPGKPVEKAFREFFNGRLHS